jgi:hypothetical protein
VQAYRQNTEEIVAVAKAASPRRLTTEQRHQFFLLADPPAWCIAQEKSPYNTLAWKHGSAATHRSKRGYVEMTV